MDPSALLASNWLGIVATTGHLGIVLLILRRGRKNPIWLPLLLLCTSMTAWSFAAAIHAMFGGFGWRWFEGTISPFLIPLRAARGADVRRPTSPTCGVPRGELPVLHRAVGGGRHLGVRPQRAGAQPTIASMGGGLPAWDDRATRLRGPID